MKKILLVGCGELGSRFLQASLQVNGVNQIDVLELSDQAVEVAKYRMNQIQFYQEAIKVKWNKSFNSVGQGADLCIIATQADGREHIFNEVFNLGIKHILTEKIVTQSLPAFNEILSKVEKLGVNVWVNCKTRDYPVWQYIKTKIDPEGELLYHSIGGNHGLCTNGLHTLDLFSFISESTELIDTNSQIDPVLHTTKRNKYDLSGAFHLTGAGKSKCIIDYSGSGSSSVLEVVATQQYRWVLDHATRQAFESSQENKWKLEPIPFEGDLSVSNMSIKFISDILKKNQCGLPTLKQTYAAHEFLFSVTLPVFNKLLGKHDSICPIT
jgi:predicted dehydrogenase